MNLHALHQLPAEIPPMLDDLRIGKMLMEANQMLSLAVKVHESSNPLARIVAPEHIGPGMVCAGMAHLNHPVSIWVRHDFSNFLWTAVYADHLGKEFAYRFGKVHASAPRTKFIMDHYQNNVPGGPGLPFQNSARHVGRGIDFSDEPNVHMAYMKYMLVRWEGDKYPPKWTKRQDPRLWMRDWVQK